MRSGSRVVTLVVVYLFALFTQIFESARFLPNR